MRNAIHAVCCCGQYLSSCPGSVVKVALGLPEGRMFIRTLSVASLLRNGLSPAYAAALAIVACNRNVAIFLIAASASQSEEFLIFLGCYQFPMYLTPRLMRPVLGKNPLSETN
jgi:arsenite transporter